MPIQEEHASNATSHMRPRVLDRIEKNSKGTSPTTRVSAGKQVAKRGPKNRPTYRLWEHATWRVRMRAWCNSIKSALLGDRHEPGRSQTYKVLQSEKCPIDNASTWLTWWAGDAVPRPTHVRAAERLAPGSSKLIDMSAMGTPELRHLVALDILNTKFRQSGRPSLYQRTQSQLLLTALNEAWAPFLSVRTPTNGSRFALETQIGQEGATLLNPVEVDEVRLQMINEGGNLRRFALPRAAILEHSWLEPLSIFRFLGALANFSELENPALLRMWACDFASAAMVVRTQLELAGETEMHVWRMGRAGIIYVLAAITFWAHISPKFDRWAAELAESLNAADALQIRERLRGARVAYYRAFAGWGIPERAIRALNADHAKKTWDGAFSAARARI
jgi:hypothetical protein